MFGQPESARDTLDECRLVAGHAARGSPAGGCARRNGAQPRGGFEGRVTVSFVAGFGRGSARSFARSGTLVLVAEAVEQALQLATHVMTATTVATARVAGRLARRFTGGLTRLRAGRLARLRTRRLATRITLVAMQAIEQPASPRGRREGNRETKGQRRHNQSLHLSVPFLNNSFDRDCRPDVVGDLNRRSP